MQEEIDELPQRAKDKHKENKRFFQRLKKKKPKDLDHQMQVLHDQEFQKMDCRDCANCCKTTGPLFTSRDISRISKYLGMKSSEFTAHYLRQDEEGDFVLQRLPCPFLAEDNSCSIYDFRPKACAEFPHTDRRDFQNISQLTLKNVAICPAAFRIVEEMKKKLKLR